MITERIEYPVLLAGFLVIMRTTVVQSETAWKCYNDTEGPVCFIAETLRDNRLRDWSTAKDYCQKLNNSTLPIAMTPLEHFHLTEFLVENDFTLDSVWLGGKGFSNGFSWTWVDGNTQVTGSLSTSSLSPTVAAITEYVDANDTTVTHGTLVEENLGKENLGYICQFKACTGKEVGVSYKVGGSCFVRYDESINWFLARNKCLQRGGDLATLTNANDDGIKMMLDELKYPPQTKAVWDRYWIGLRKIWWKWLPANTEIKTVYFKDNPILEIPNNADQNCLAIDYKQQFAWSIRNCSVKLQTICQDGGSWASTPTAQAPVEGPSTTTVSLPVWAVGLICGLAGFFYIVSLIVVGIICCKCCGNKTSKKNGDDEGGNRPKNNYVSEPQGVHHAPPQSPRQVPRQPPAVPRANDEGDFDGDYEEGEFDDDYYDMPEDQRPAGGVYANHAQVPKPPGRGRPR